MGAQGMGPPGLAKQSATVASPRLQVWGGGVHGPADRERRVCPQPCTPAATQPGRTSWARGSCAWAVPCCLHPESASFFSEGPGPREVSVSAPWGCGFLHEKKVLLDIQGKAARHSLTQGRQAAGVWPEEAEQCPPRSAGTG